MAKSKATKPDGGIHERGLVEFVLAHRRERYLDQLSDPKKRKKFLDRLPHFGDWEESRTIQIPPREHTVKTIAQRLRSLGAPDDCWTVSSESRFDAHDRMLDKALGDVVGTLSGTVVSCIPGCLAYFEGEALGRRFILYAARQSKR